MEQEKRPLTQSLSVMTEQLVEIASHMGRDSVGNQLDVGLSGTKW